MNPDAMDMESEMFLQDANTMFAAGNDAKYRKGQKEHGPNLLWEVPNLLREAKSEVMDQWNYLHALEAQHRLIKELCVEIQLEFGTSASTWKKMEQIKKLL